MWLFRRNEEFRVILCLKKRCRSLCLVPVGVVGNSDAQGNQIHFASHNRKCSSRLILRKRCSRNPTGRRKPHEGCDVWSMGCLLLDLFLRSRTAAKTWSDECFDTSSKITSRCGGRPVSIQAAARWSQEKLTTMEMKKNDFCTNSCRVNRNPSICGNGKKEQLATMEIGTTTKEKLATMEIGTTTTLHQLLQGESESRPSAAMVRRNQGKIGMIVTGTTTTIAPIGWDTRR